MNPAVSDFRFVVCRPDMLAHVSRQPTLATVTTVRHMSAVSVGSRGRTSRHLSGLIDPCWLMTAEVYLENSS